MRASEILIIITLVSAPAHAAHKSWLICPKQAVMLIVSLASTPDTDEQRKQIRERWCYDLTVPHERIVPASPDLPEWVIPHDAIDWIALEIKNK